MNAPMIITILISLGLTVAVLTAIPEMSRPTLPLGVSVPSDRVDDPTVRRAIRRYRRWSLLGGAIAAVITVISHRTPELSTLVLLGYIAWAMIGFAVCRRPIVAAKADGHWYDGVSVRVYGSVTPDRPAAPLWPVLILSAGFAVAAAVAVMVNYSSLPDPLPTHYDDAGNVTSWTPKSWWAALMLPAAALAAVLLTAATSVMISRRQSAFLPDGRPHAARAFQHGTARSLQRALAALALVSAAGMSALAAAPVIRFTSSGFAWATWGLVAASSLPVLWLIADTARRRRTLAASSEAHGPESPDDDHLWKWGLFYINREDPRMLVPKRNGVGLDVNLGHPGGVAFMGFTVLSILATIALVLTSSLHPGA